MVSLVNYTPEYAFMRKFALKLCCNNKERTHINVYDDKKVYLITIFVLNFTKNLLLSENTKARLFEGIFSNKAFTGEGI